MIDDLTISSDALALVAVGALSFTVALVSPAAGAGANLGISTLAAASAATANVRAHRRVAAARLLDGAALDRRRPGGGYGGQVTE